MEAQGVTAARLAELAGMSRPGVSRILNGRENVTLVRAQRIAEALGVDLSELVAEKICN